MFFPSVTPSHLYHMFLLSSPGHPQQPTLPLVRVRVIYSEEEQVFNVSRFGFKFEGSVANTEDLIIFNRERAERGQGGERASSPGLRADLINVDDVSVIGIIIVYYYHSKRSAIWVHHMQPRPFLGVLKIIKKKIKLMPKAVQIACTMPLSFATRACHLRLPYTHHNKHSALNNKVTLTWLKQHGAAGMLVRDAEVLNAAGKFAQLQDVKDLKESSGWLIQFKRRHSLSN